MCSPGRPPIDTRSEPGCGDRRGLPWRSESRSSFVAVCRSWLSLRATPISMPCVKTLLPPIVPAAPSGAKVTESLLGSSRQFAGTLTWKRFPSL